VLLTKAANVKMDTAASSKNQTANNQTVKVMKQKVTQWKDTISKMKEELAAATRKTAEAKEEAAQAMKADESAKQDADREQEKVEQNATRANDEVDKLMNKTGSVDDKALAREAKKAQATADEVEVGNANIETLLKLKTEADLNYAKAKRQHALEGSDEGPEAAADPKKERGLLKTLAKTAKAKNIADLRYAKAQEKLKRANENAKTAMSKLKKDESSPALDAVKTAEKAEASAMRLEGKANEARLHALKEITTADEKAQKKLAEQEKLAQQITKIKAKAKVDVFRVEQAKERTQKLKVSATEKASKAESLRGLRKRAEEQVDAQEADFSLETMANKIRAAKASHEAASKKTAVATQTLGVLRDIDKAAQKEARMVTAYQHKESGEKSKAGITADKGAKKLRKERLALQKTSNSVLGNARKVGIGS